MTTKVLLNWPHVSVCVTGAVVPATDEEMVSVGPKRLAGLYVANGVAGLVIEQALNEASAGTGVTNIFCGLPPMLMKGLLNKKSVRGTDTFALTVNVLLRDPQVTVCLVSAVIASADGVRAITVPKDLSTVTVESTGVPVIEQVGNTVSEGDGVTVRFCVVSPTFSSEPLSKISAG